MARTPARTAPLLLLTALSALGLDGSARAQEPRARVRRAELAVERLDIDSDGVPWSFVEVRYPRVPWTAARAAAWGRPEGLLQLGDELARTEIRTGSWVDFGDSGLDTSEEGDRPAVLAVRFRGPHDPDDDRPLWLESFETALDEDSPNPDLWGSMLEVDHAPLTPPSERLAIRLVPGSRKIRADDPDPGDTHGRFPARLEIRWGPHLLTGNLRIELPTPIPSRSGTRLSGELRTAIERARHVEFLALDPLEEQEATETFHEFEVFATAAGTDPTLRRRLAAGLRRAALLGPPWSVDCFEPELGIRIRDPALGDFDVLISASCSSMNVWRLGAADPTGPNLDEAITAELIRAVDQASGFVR